MLAKLEKMAGRYFLFLAHKQGQGVVQKVGLAFDFTVELNNIICTLTTWFLPFFLSPLPRPEILGKGRNKFSRDLSKILSRWENTFLKA